MPIRFNPAQRICRDPFTAIAIGLGAFSALGAISAGFAEKRTLEDQADQQREQARITAFESEAEAVRREEERDRVLATQRVAFAANGIRVTPGAGSVLAVMEDATRQFNMEVAAVRRQGEAQTKFAFREAAITQNKARAAVLAGFTKAAGTLASTASTANSAGLFSKTTATNSALSRQTAAFGGGARTHTVPNTSTLTFSG